MTELDTRILGALSKQDAQTPAEIARDILAHHGVVQEALHRLDDDGHVRMRNGFYSLTMAARRNMAEPPDPPLPDCVVEGENGFIRVDR